ncbi:MAG: hypothetical protein QNK40_16385 [Desulfobacterales bacterium]|nr:hypothetical protein [Desulfobacterales bacterium]
MKAIGRKNDLEALNYQGVQIAKEVAEKGNYFLAGNISNTWVYDPGLRIFKLNCDIWEMNHPAVYWLIFYQHFYFRIKK